MRVCVPARSWEVQQGVQMLTGERGSPIAAPDRAPSPIGVREPGLSGSRCGHLGQNGEKMILCGKCVLHGKDRIINPRKGDKMHYFGNNPIAIWGAMG